MPVVKRVISPVVRSAFPLLVVFLAAIFSGILEKVPGAHFFHVLSVIGGLGLIAVAVGGRIPVVGLQNPIGKALTVFTGWFLFCIPFAIWRGGSFHVLTDKWYKSALVFLLTAGLITSIDQCKKIFRVIGYSVGVLSILALLLRGYDPDGRLGLINTRYENANDFAWTLILGLAFLSFSLLRGSVRQKAASLIFSIPIVLALLKTGSRAGMIGVAMLVVFGFLQASRTARIKLAASLPILLLVLAFATPESLRSRYTTFFKAESGITASESAAESTSARMELLKDSIQVTLMHPLFGVGPGNFEVAQNELALARGESYGLWHVTHNTYTQISSEMGIPGLIIYLVFLYQCFRPLNSIMHTQKRSEDWRDLRALAQCLRAALVIIVTIALFDSYAYDINVPMLAGLCCALTGIAQRQIALGSRSKPIQAVDNLRLDPVVEPVGMVYL